MNKEYKKKIPIGIFIYLNGGANRDRTDDPLRARQVLSQLSYNPIPKCGLIIA